MNLLPKELAERLRVHVGTLATWRVQGRGPKFIKSGKRVLYPVKEVEAWESDNLKRSTAG